MKNLIILHGALGAKIQFEQLVQKLTPHFNIYSFDFDGHGSKSNADGEFSIELFAQNLKDFMTFHEIHKPLIFGYSMGGYVALKLEGFEANSFEKVVTLGTKFDWNPVTSEKEAGMLNAEKIEAKVPEFANYLKSLHGEIGWKLVLERTAKMMMGLGKNPSLRPYDFHHIQIPVQLLRGSEDTMVSKSETKNVQELLANGKFQEIENWMHPIDKISVDDLAQELLRVYLPG